MPPRKLEEIPVAVRMKVIEAYKTEKNKAEIGRLLGIPRTTIVSIIKKFEVHGSVENRHRSGRKPKFSVRDEVQLSRIMKSNRRGTLDDITSEINNAKDSTFCSKTVRRKLFKMGYNRRVQKKKMIVRVCNRKKRVSWCRERKNWTVDDHWKNWIFSDECQVVIGDNNRVYVWRKTDEVDNPHLVCAPSKSKLSVMIWGCICYDGVGTLTSVNGNINSEKYIDILENNLWPVIVRHFPHGNYVFQDDNAPVHRSRLLSAYMEENNINTTSWPAQSPDINIIENIWLKLKRHLQSTRNTIESKDQLIAEVTRFWQNQSVEYVRQLYDTIPTRLLEVIKMKGNLTKY